MSDKTVMLIHRGAFDAIVISPATLNIRSSTTMQLFGIFSPFLWFAAEHTVTCLPHRGNKRG
jgi:hypothetical protein